MNSAFIYFGVASLAFVAGTVLQPFIWREGFEVSWHGHLGSIANRPQGGAGNQDSGGVKMVGSVAQLEEFAASNRHLLGDMDIKLKRDALVMMLELLSRSNPEEAARILDSANASDFGKQGLRLFVKVAEKWSANDPAAAYAWILGQQGRISQDGFESALAYTAANFIPYDPSRSLEILGSISNPDFHAVTKEEIAKRWVKHDPQGAFDWLAAISSDGTTAEDVNAYYLTMMRTYSRTHPAMAAELVAQLKSATLRENLVPAVTRDLLGMTGGFEAAFEWVKGLPDPASRNSGIRTLVELRGQGNLSSLVEYLVDEANPSLATKRLLVSSLRVLASSDHEHAISLLPRVPEDARYAAAESITKAGLVGSEAQVTSWIATLGPGPVRDGALTALAVNKMESDLGIALEWSRAVGDDARRSQIVREMARYGDLEFLPTLATALPEMNLHPEQRTIVEQIISERNSNH